MCVLTTAESRVKIHPYGFSCCIFQGDGSGVVDSLFIIAHEVLGVLCLVPVFVMQYLMSFLVFFTVEERAGCFTLIVFLLSCSGTCYVSSLAVVWVGLWSMIVAFPQFPGLTPTVLLFVLSVMVIPKYFID